MTDQLVAQSVADATIHAPIAAIDLTEWVFTLADSEYQACSVNHIAGSSCVSPEGKRMSINVEHVGYLMIQHYVEDIAERGRTRLVSLTDSIGPDIDSKTKIKVIWEFHVEPIDANTTRFFNKVEVRTTPEYLQALEKRGVALEKASQYAQQATTAHNLEETPLFAKDIERKAVAGRWG